MGESVKRLRNFVAGGFVVALGVRGIRNIIETNTAVETLRISLESVTGSAANASAAFEEINRFAARTPFTVLQLTEAFRKLRVFGLDASNDALRSYGNTALAFGRSLDQLVEAVTDATTGEFERLKEFGIRASQEGDRVTFTFRGVSTTVRRESGAIERYLQNIGRTQFGGSIERQLDSIAGAMSQLEDAATRLIVDIGEAGLNTAIRDLALELAGATEDATPLATVLGRTLAEGARIATDAVRALNVTLGVLQSTINVIRRLRDLLPQSLIERYNQDRLRTLQRQEEFERLVERATGIRRRIDEQQPRGSDLRGLSAGAASAGVVPAATPADVDTTNELADRIREATEALEHENRIALRARNEQAALNALRQAGSTAIIGQTEAYDEFIARLSAAERGLVAEAERQVEIRAAAEATAAARREERREIEEANARVAEALRNLASQERAQLPLYQQRILAAREWRESMREVLSSVEEDWGSLESRIDETYAAMIREAERLRDSQRTVWEEIGDTVERSMNRATDALLAFVSTGKASIGDFVRAVLLDLGRIALQRSIVQPLFSALGGFIPGAATVGHAGAIAGAATGVRRYHTGGIASDEVPAILRRGEGVFTPEQMRALGPPAAPQVVINFENAGTPQQETSRSVETDGRRTLISIVVDDVDRRGDISRALEQGYGLSRRAR